MFKTKYFKDLHVFEEMGTVWAKWIDISFWGKVTYNRAWLDPEVGWIDKKDGIRIRYHRADRLLGAYRLHLLEKKLGLK